MWGVQVFFRRRNLVMYFLVVAQWYGWVLVYGTGYSLCYREWLGSYRLF